MADFYCELCQRWTAPDTGSNPPICSNCGEGYSCGECGYEINAAGECQRPIDLGACPGEEN